MKPTRRARVKICCISSPAEAELAVAHGASALGLVAAMPSGPGVIGEEAIAAIARRVPPGVSSFLLTSRQDAEGIAAQQRRCGTSVVQICDRVEPGVFAALRATLPGIRLVQVIHVVGPESIDEALAAAVHADALLLDSGRPDAAVKELGGTGRRHDWTISRRIREQAPVPTWLAGGLRPDNVAEAIAVVAPFGLDLCTGVRADGHLDPHRLGRFMDMVRAASD